MIKAILAVLLITSVLVVGVLVGRAIQPHQTTAVAAETTAQEPAAPKDQILVAARPLQPGILLRAQDVQWAERAGEAQPGDVVRPSVEQRTSKPESDEAARATVYGAALRVPLAPGQPILPPAIVKPGDREFLQTVLTSGRRAITIGVAGAAGQTGLMFPGDQVDVMLTQNFKNEEAPLTRRSVSETVVENLRLLAIEKETKQQIGPQAGSISVTLEVAPQQAEKINVAQELGKLSLTLRSVGETDAARLGPTWAGDVSPALSAAIPPAKTVQAEKPAIRVMHGANSTEIKSE